MTGELPSRTESIEERFEAREKVLSGIRCVGSSDKVDSALLCRVCIGALDVDERLGAGLALSADGMLTESRFFLLKGVVTLPNTPVTPPKKALPPPATSFGAFVMTSSMPLPTVSKV